MWPLTPSFAYHGGGFNRSRFVQQMWNNGTMKSFGLWVAGMRPRTLPASIAPVVVGAVAAYVRLRDLTVCVAIYPMPRQCVINAQRYAAAMANFAPVAILCALVALFLQIAVNFANDYSDGIRGTDASRGDEESQTKRPQRVTASGLVPARMVLVAAAINAAAACACGLAAILISHAFWLLLLGALCLPAGWFYTGGRRPYGYMGFGELGVFLFFGLAAVLGTEYALAGGISTLGVAGAVCCGLFACALLMVNNLRDIDEDRLSGKHTLAVRLGPANSRRLLLAAYLIPLAATVAVAVMPLIFGIVQWMGVRCGEAQSVPGCAAGATNCSTQPVTSWWCATPVAPALGLWLLACAGLLCIAAGIALVRGLLQREYGRALAVSGMTSLLFAAVFVLAGLASVLPFTGTQAL